MDIKQQEGQI